MSPNLWRHRGERLLLLQVAATTAKQIGNVLSQYSSLLWSYSVDTRSGQVIKGTVRSVKVICSDYCRIIWLLFCETGFNHSVQWQERKEYCKEQKNNVAIAELLKNKNKSDVFFSNQILTNGTIITFEELHGCIISYKICQVCKSTQLIKQNGNLSNS